MKWPPIVRAEIHDRASTILCCLLQMKRALGGLTIVLLVFCFTAIEGCGTPPTIPGMTAVAPDRKYKVNIIFGREGEGVWGKMGMGIGVL